ncbi:sal-like protein 3 [Varroa destructor]|uniref:C2H2-type domain-containing protein n=1 Tax=Varroa destructor TaxID=109461 RepID=A0A7M7IYP2_VARDE|nr:sal-like protein 3 [Varroa destructor]
MSELLTVLASLLADVNANYLWPAALAAFQNASGQRSESPEPGNNFSPTPNPAPIPPQGRRRMTQQNPNSPNKRRGRYQCGYCNFLGVTPSHMKRHILIHTGERPFECPLCPRRFTQKVHLKYHMNKTHKLPGIPGDNNSSPLPVGQGSPGSGEEGIAPVGGISAHDDDVDDVTVIDDGPEPVNPSSLLHTEMTSFTPRHRSPCSGCDACCPRDKLGHSAKSHQLEQQQQQQQQQHRKGLKEKLRFGLTHSTYLTLTSLRLIATAVFSLKHFSASFLINFYDQHAGFNASESLTAVHLFFADVNANYLWPAALAAFQNASGQRSESPEPGENFSRTASPTLMPPPRRRVTQQDPNSPNKRRGRYQCSFCNFLGVTPSHIKRHILTHTGERPFECPLCPRRFTQKVHLKYHINKTHKMGSAEEISPVGDISAADDDVDELTIIDDTPKRVKPSSLLRTKMTA